MDRQADWQDELIPAIYPQTYLHVAEKRGADRAAIVRQAGLPAALFDLHTEIRMPQLRALVTAILAAVGDHGLGVDIGWNLPPTAFGSFGYALLCSASMRDVLDLTRRYWHLAQRATDLLVLAEGETCVVELTPAVQIPARLRPLVLEAAFTGLYRGFLLLTGEPPQGSEIWFDFPAPDHADRVRSTLGNIRYAMPASRFRFPRRLLETRLPMHNPVALKFALEQCEREDALRASDSGRFASRVREKAVFTAHGYPGLADLARRLHVTPRTLRRRLEREGTSYRKLLEEARRRDALRLLDDHALGIQRVARLLGYRDPANFTRAFRRWAGQTASQYRATRKSG